MIAIGVPLHHCLQTLPIRRDVLDRLTAFYRKYGEREYEIVHKHGFNGCLEAAGGMMAEESE